VVTVDFTLEVAKLRAVEFVRCMLERLDMRELWIGHDFTLGYQREGNAAFSKIYLENSDLP
jgi:FAD synthase